MTIITAVVFLLLIVGIIGIYNNGIRLRNFVEEAFSTMDVYLKKRWDLIPNLVETTKGYMEHESKTFAEITKLRTANYNQLSMDEKMQVNSALTQGLSRLIATAEAYPDLKANENFQQLSRELSAIEEDIANSRKYYNGTVREFNTFIEAFPACMVAPMFHFEKQKMFQIDEAQRENVKVSFK